MGVEDEQVSKRMRMRMINGLSMIPSRILPPEIIVEILLRFPVETLLRCKSVCKSWYELISSRYFINSHVKLWNEKNRYVSPKLMFNVRPIYSYRAGGYTRTIVAAPYMISCCNGLLCYVKDRNTPFFYNPSTRVSNTLPSSGCAGAGYAFGYDESTYDYKVIALSSRGNKAKIYSLKTGVWKNINDVPHIPPWFNRATFSNGAFHWMVYGVRDSWTKLVSIPYVTHKLGLYEVPLSISNDGKLLLKINHKLLVYDSINCKFDEIHDFGARFEACSLVESLVSPHSCPLDLRSWRLNYATHVFLLLIQASKEFVIDERITWVDIEGIPLKLWSESTFNRIAAKWGKMLYLEKLDERCLYSKRLCILTTGKSNILETFKIIHKGKRFSVRAKETMGWIPDFDEQEEDNEAKSDRIDGFEENISKAWCECPIDEVGSHPDRIAFAASLYTASSSSVTFVIIKMLMGLLKVKLFTMLIRLFAHCKIAASTGVSDNGLAFANAAMGKNAPMI
ncbi:nucleotide-binding alpha-beta plait domain-containing protein [Tanacetum coccineum]